MIVITIIATMFLVNDLLPTIFHSGDDGSQVIRSGLFATVVFILIYGNVVYLVTRLGYFVRRLRHRPPAFETLVESHWDGAEPIVVLVPSYKEDVRTIRQTLLSAALQHHPRKRVVLLVDDPPRPNDRESVELLAAARRVPGEIMSLLQEPKSQIEMAFQEFSVRWHGGAIDAHAELRRLLDVYEGLIAWMDRCAAEGCASNHTDRHFLGITFGEHKALLGDSARRLVADLAGNTIAPAQFGREYQRLADLFDVEITSFERKRYRNVSQEANKAANLNTYIELLGQTVRERWHPDGLRLEIADRTEQGSDVLAIPDATFVLTLDADSMLRPDYALRLSSVFAEPGNERVAVVQTPYTAIPNAPGVLERIAGATTDIQYIVHQGFTWCDATFWVGANALLRKRALDDIRTEELERGYVVSKFIQDHTVIEDTESTVDLAFHGWTLTNYPERLAFSATPPDFGSLLIQRRRWANGGLLIVPKLVQHALTRPFAAISVPSFLVRLHYLSSIATGSIGMLILLFLPMDTELFSVWLPVLAVAYLSMYWRDLIQNGYRSGDILRVSAFNVMLLPINLAGVLKSLHQGMTGVRTPFARTPKVEGRTAAPAWAVLSLWLLLAWSLLAGVLHVAESRWMYAAFSLLMAAAFGYAAIIFVGLKAGWEDVARGVQAQARPFFLWHDRRTPSETRNHGS
jgi:cellulose synthase/poly-beta-1,6-N-acetylglucosamine synthase-like glycosyltransferase